LLGQYEKFPQIVHGIGNFTYKVPADTLQQTIAQVFQRLNNENHDLNDITYVSKSPCDVNFEIGIAEDDAFNFLDGEELERLQKNVERKALPLLDFFMIIRYHIVKEDGKRVPLKFDHYFLRFNFYQRDLELRMVHERGTQHIHLEDLIDFMVKQLNKELVQRKLETLNKRYLRTL